jgi:hypothetical protein
MDVSMLQRRSSEVDILLGCDYFGLHPKQEVGVGGDNLSVMKGDLGLCLQGSHPELQENTEVSSHLVKVLHGYKLKTNCNFLQTHSEYSHPTVSPVQDCYVNVVSGKKTESPQFLYSPLDTLKLKSGPQKDEVLPGEKKVVLTSAAAAVKSDSTSLGIQYSRFSNICKVYWVVARILNMLRSKSLKGGKCKLISPDLLIDAEKLLLCDKQRSAVGEFKEIKGRYCALQPVQHSLKPAPPWPAILRSVPAPVHSDPGSQLVGVSHELKDAWAKIDHALLTKEGSENGLSWVFGPADSPWHQGAVESMVKAAKRAFEFSVHNQRLSPCEFLTMCAEAANMINERRIGTMLGIDADISVLTPNCFLLGRATVQNPRCWQPQSLSLSNRFHMTQRLLDVFWQKWCELCAPGLVVQRKWHTAVRNLKAGDVVTLADKNTLRGSYRLALVKEVFPSRDGRVRKVKLIYKNFKVGEKVSQYHGAIDTAITRSVQRLALLVPAE